MFSVTIQDKSKVSPGFRESATMADMEERFVPEDRVSLKVSVHTLQVFYMATVGDSADIDPIIQLLPYTYQYLMVNTSDCMLNPLSQLC